MKDFLKPKKLFIWDFDGSLCNTERLHFLAYEKAFAEHGHKISETEYYTNFSMNGKGAQFEIDRYNLTVDADTIKKKKKIYYWNLIEETKPGPFPEIYPILLHLKKHGVASWIASNSPKDEIQRILASSQQVVQLLDGIEGFVEGRAKKPAPDIFNDVRKKVGCSIEETLIVEDSVIGLKAAAASQCEAVWVRSFVNENFDMQEPYMSELSHADLKTLVLNTYE